MKLRRNLYSGVSEANPGGIGYQTAQVTSEYILDPVEKVIYKIEDSKISDIGTVKKNTNRVKGVVKPFNDYIKYLKEKQELSKKKKKSKKKSKSFSELSEKLFGRSFLGRKPLIMGNSSRRVPSVLHEIPNLPSQNRRSVNNIRFSSNTQPKPGANLPVPVIKTDNIKNSTTPKQAVNNTIPTNKNIPVLVPKIDNTKDNITPNQTVNRRVSRKNRKTILDNRGRYILVGSGIGIGGAALGLGLSKENKEDN